jgi:hypothetical protein
VLVCKNRIILLLYNLPQQDAPLQDVSDGDLLGWHGIECVVCFHVTDLGLICIPGVVVEGVGSINQIKDGIMC